MHVCDLFQDHDNMHAGAMEEHELTTRGAVWRRCGYGLHIEGQCTSPDCQAFGMLVIDCKVWGWQPAVLLQDLTGSMLPARQSRAELVSVRTSGLSRTLCTQLAVQRHSIVHN